eukprot:TRINITY_DN2401_c0_g1_i2.p1 TRINITY_DN2401_c0_g1~~TRINITY_DN2401_c0_g1_i2.p1  ORF type:complete len:335 (+),score=58.41 TRINITY_DN2401_c0_g1_i2:113-1117(+)
MAILCLPEALMTHKNSSICLGHFAKRYPSHITENVFHFQSCRILRNGASVNKRNNILSRKKSPSHRHYSFRVMNLQKQQQEVMKPPYNVLITGASKGIGYALAEEFLKAGDNVIICSRSEDRIKIAEEKLRRKFGDHAWGTTCDVRDGASVQSLVAFARATMDHIDIWINNAGSNAYNYKPLVENEDESLMEVVATNALGSMICCREAIRMMSSQSRGGHIFNMDGAGSDGRPTPRYAAYGATKRSIVHLTKSLQAELKMQGIKKIVMHNLSPGMVTTDLLMSGSTTKQAKFFINVLAETPETVADFFTKALNKARFQDLRGRLKILDIKVKGE